MSYQERKEIYKEIEKHRNRPLIVYVTSHRPGLSAMITNDAIREIEDQLIELKPNTHELDLLINSFGGDGITSWKIVGLIRQYLGEKGKLYVIIPHEAYSAGTLIALGANEIYMHNHACLGPTDPQLITNKKGEVKRFGYEDLIAFVDFLSEEGKLSEQKYRSDLIKHIISEIEPTALGFSKRSSQQALTMAQLLLKMHMKNEKAAEAEAIARQLNKSYYNHGHAVFRQDAINLGLNIAERNIEFDEIIWKLYKNFEEEMQTRVPLDYGELFKNDPEYDFLFSPPPFVEIPQNASQETKNNMWNKVLSQMKIHQPRAKEIDLMTAAVEGVSRGRASFKKAHVQPVRQANLSIGYIIQHSENNWKTM